MESIENKYIYFQRAYGDGLDERKTETWDIINKKSEEPLARIEWYPAFRQYSFFPEPNTVFNNGCVKSILYFLDGLNEEHKQEIKARAEYKHKLYCANQKERKWKKHQ